MVELEVVGVYETRTMSCISITVSRVRTTVDPLTDRFVIV